MEAVSGAGDGTAAGAGPSAGVMPDRNLALLGDIERRWLVTGALLTAGYFTLIPNRMLGGWLWSG